MSADQGVGGVGVVHKNPHARAPGAAVAGWGGDALQATGYPVKIVEADKISGREARLQGQRHDGHQIGRVVTAHQGGGQFPGHALAPVSPGQAQTQAVGRIGQQFARQKRTVRAAFGQPVSRRAGHVVQQAAAVGVVGVDRHGFVAFGRVEEQAAFGLEIAFHVAVVVQMVLGQIGEQGPGEAQTGHAALIESVGRHFHNGRRHARRAHGGQIFVDGQATRRGQGRGFIMAGPTIADRAHHADRAPRGTVQMFQQIGAGGLAVGAGDADEGKGQTRRVMQGGGHVPQGEAGVVHHDQIGGDFGQIGRQGGREHHCFRAARQGVGRVFGAPVRLIRGRAGQDDKNVAGPHVARIGTDAAARAGQFVAELSQSIYRHDGFRP